MPPIVDAAYARRLSDRGPLPCLVVDSPFPPHPLVAALGSRAARVGPAALADDVIAQGVGYLAHGVGAPAEDVAAAAAAAARPPPSEVLEPALPAAARLADHAPARRARVVVVEPLLGGGVLGRVQELPAGVLEHWWRE